MSITRDRVVWMVANGFNPTDVKTWRLMWQRLKYHASTRNIGCHLTFEDYLTLAKNAGIYDPEMIGRTKGSYQLGRYGDKGDYTPDNCRFITKELNRLEMTLNGGDDAMAKSLRGRSKQTHSGVKSQSEKVSKWFKVISPDGEEFVGKNLTDFCKQYGLNRGNMSSVCRGEMTSYKGWFGEYIENQEENNQ